MASSDNPPGVLIAALVAKYAAAPSLAGIPGPYLNSKRGDKADVGLPYCVLRIIESFDDGWTCLSRRWLCVLEFEFFDSTPENANSRLNAFNAVFSPKSLVLSFPVGCGLISHRQVGGDITEAGSPDMQRAACRYKFRFWLPLVD